ncbi:MAG: hypothetical protein M3Q08_17010 [Pseudomonadota bacterium]|nr:hypothetical protein [Pseudomonadota bacterium]
MVQLQLQQTKEHLQHMSTNVSIHIITVVLKVYFVRATVCSAPPHGLASTSRSIEMMIAILPWNHV